jgi:small subunit ribosomal protein S20
VERSSVAVGPVATLTRPAAGAVPPPVVTPAGVARYRVPAVPTTKDERSVANIKSQIKRNRQNEKRRVRNKAVRSELKTRAKSAIAAAEEGAENSAEALQAAVKRIDKAAAKGVIHKNQAARRKGRLVKRINALTNKD